MDKAKKPDFVMGINVPVQIPTQEDMDYFKGKYDPFLEKLVEVEYLSEEEAAAYTLFVSEFAMFVPFIIDSFLDSYRRSKAKATEEA